jgi:hypothetical protein
MNMQDCPLIGSWDPLEQLRGWLVLLAHGIASKQVGEELPGLKKERWVRLRCPARVGRPRRWSLLHAFVSTSGRLDEHPIGPKHSSVKQVVCWS